MKKLLLKLNVIAICLLAMLACLLGLCFTTEKVEVYATTYFETESNDTKETANYIDTNVSISGALSTSRDVDWYRFEVTTDGYFNVSFEHELIDSSNIYWRIYLYDNTGIKCIDGKESYFGVNGNADKATTTFGISSGTYYVKITSNYHSGVNYQLTVNFTEADDWETENNNSMSEADEIPVNRLTNGALTTSGDEDWYKFTTTADGYFNVFFEHELINSSSMYWRIYLYDNTGIKYIDGSKTNFGVYGNEDKTTNTFGISSGTYYFKITSNYHSGVNYQLTVNFTEADDWETENNNSMSEADEIPVNRLTNGALTTSGDVDWYKFTTTTDGYFYVFFNHTLIDSSDRCWYIYLYDNSGVTPIDGNITFISVNGNADKTTAAFGVPKGTYYVKIEAYFHNHSGVNYQLTVNFTEADDWEAETNNSMSSADEIPVNRLTNGVITTKKDNDWYKFDLNSSCEVAIQFDHEQVSSSASYWGIILYDNSGVTSLYSLNSRGDKESCISEYMELGSGTYYIKVEPDYYDYLDKNYQLTILEKHDHNGIWEQTKAPTCTEKGIESRTCNICGIVDTREVEANGHTYDDGKIIKEAGITQKGEIEYTCIICGDKHTETDGHLLWVLPVICVGGVVLVIGLVNYIISIKKKRR